ncbi:hypothetical protein [Pseudomonas sp. NBRC 111134]|mgnify:CR=1 FL=1|uniref:hypothetical protein n=1 Tax=Pseudomonas sp. NBRC 111134 TaxID=1661049 RepID=UPI000760DC08|nr:hypothetical protein [Pseudomonas sp. NBRC 111134]
MAMDNEHNQSSSELNGWDGLIMVSVNQLNTALAKAHEQTDSQPLMLETIITPGQTWFRSYGVVGAPLLAVGSTAGSAASASLSRVLSEAVELIMGKNSGVPVRSVMQVSKPSRDALLRADFLLAEREGTYRPDGLVVLSDVPAADYHLIRDGQDDTLMAARYAQALRSINDSLMSLGRQQYNSPLFANASFKLTVVKPIIYSEELVLYFSFSQAIRDTLRSAVPTTPVHRVEHDKNHSFMVQVRMATKRVPGDAESEWLLNLPYIIYPYQTLRAGQWQPISEEIYQMIFLPRLSLPDAITVRAEPLDAIKDINPIITVVQRGSVRYPMQVAMTHPAGVSLIGDVRGTLQREAGVWFYKSPPVLPASSVTPDDDSKTVPLAVLKAGDLVPVNIDIAQIDGGGASASAAFLIFNMTPTHFLRLGKVQGKLQLSLCFINKNDVEEVVDPADIEWTVLAGNGSVSQEGLYTPGTDLRGCSAILAVESDNRRWYWAVAVLPPLAVDQLVDLQ